MAERLSSKDKLAAAREAKAGQMRAQEGLVQRELTSAMDRMGVLNGEMQTAKERLQGTKDAITSAREEELGEAVIAELVADQNTIEEELRIATGELSSLESRPDVKAQRQKEAEEQRAQQAVERKTQEHKGKVKELGELEQDVNEVLRLEQEINTLGRELTEFCRKDNGWVLTSPNEPLAFDVARNKTGDTLKRLQTELSALEGKWFKGGTRRDLQAQIVEEKENVKLKNDELTVKYNSAINEVARLRGELGKKLIALYPAVDKVQRQAPEKPDRGFFPGTQDIGGYWQPNEYKRVKHAEKAPASAEEAIQMRFPFVINYPGHGKEVRINLGELLKHYGYKRK